ncbi:MAG: preprotein translocase subunit YajC [Clostridiales bacterium]|nr:preprotein translocase subunit YajC [Clostridiales bacterium]
MFHFALDAATTDANQAGGANPLIMVAIFAFFIIIWYFLALRPQRKKEKELKAKIEKMRVGDQVITIGGLVGKVANIRDDEVTIMTSAANTLVTFKKNAVNTIISRDAKAAEKAATKDSSEEKKSDKIVLKKKEKEASSDTEKVEASEETASDLGEIKE